MKGLKDYLNRAFFRGSIADIIAFKHTKAERKSVRPRGSFVVE